MAKGNHQLHFSILKNNGKLCKWKKEAERIRKGKKLSGNGGEGESRV